MVLKEQLRKILECHNHPQTTPDNVLFSLLSPYSLHKPLAVGSPYLNNKSEVRQEYVTECLNSATEIYRSLDFGTELLIVYEDYYSEDNLDEKEFVESCLKEIDQIESYSFTWNDFSKKKSDSWATKNNERYTCTRRIYEAEGIHTQQLFSQIILSDIGGKYDLCSKIFIIDKTTGCIFHLYDCRDLWISGGEGMYFPQVGTRNDQVNDREYNNLDYSEFQFSMLYKNFHWINGLDDDPEDLCLHGTVHVRIGEEGFTYPCCVSAAALRMLKTLIENHEVADSGGEQMLPCCGHTLIADNIMENVSIIGCANGVDWAVRHEKSGILLETVTGRQVLVDKTLYRNEVFRFADSVEKFYKRSSSKILPEDAIDRAGYQAFWNEWHRRRENN